MWTLQRAIVRICTAVLSHRLHLKRQRDCNSVTNGSNNEACLGRAKNTLGPNNDFIGNATQHRFRQN